VIQKNMRVTDILTILPEAETVFAQYGLHCSGCSIGGAETLGDAVSMHGMKDDDVDDLLADLHVLLARRPSRPQTLTITDAAASALHDILAVEGKTAWILRVGLDEAGGYGMELVEKAHPDDHVFPHNGVTASASVPTLTAIGGSTIDYRDGRFKLDLPAGQAGLPRCTGGCGESCDCGTDRV
jgi:hybrid cluster-associated redox disulfide protein